MKGVSFVSNQRMYQLFKLRDSLFKNTQDDGILSREYTLDFSSCYLKNPDFSNLNLTNVNFNKAIMISPKFKDDQKIYQCNLEYSIVKNPTGIPNFRCCLTRHSIFVDLSLMSKFDHCFHTNTIDRYFKEENMDEIIGKTYEEITGNTI